jgi:exodeoxyribonuclease X
MNIIDATFIVADTETTGLEAGKDQLVEIGAVATSFHGPMGMFGTLVNPGVRIPPEISAVHGIVERDVEKAPAPTRALSDFRDFFERFNECGRATPAAHNAEFDAGFLEIVDGRIVCTRRLAMHIWPHAPNYKNQTLRYWRGLEVETFGIAPHRALGDALVTAALLRDELTCGEFRVTGITTVEELIAFVDSPVLMLTMPFGKHRGFMKDVPRDYIEWALGPRGLTDMSKDLRYTFEQIITDPRRTLPLLSEARKADVA